MADLTALPILQYEVARDTVLEGAAGGEGEGLSMSDREEMLAAWVRALVKLFELHKAIDEYQADEILSPETAGKLRDFIDDVVACAKDIAGVP